MDDAALVRGVERVGDLPRDGPGRRRPGTAPGEAIREVSPSTSSITSARTVPISSRPWNAGNVRVVERGQRPRFALEAREAVGIGGERSGRIFSATSRARLVSRAR